MQGVKCGVEKCKRSDRCANDEKEKDFKKEKVIKTF